MYILPRLKIVVSVLWCSVPYFLCLKRKKKNLSLSLQLEHLHLFYFYKEVGQFSKFLMPENHPMVNQVRRVGNQLLQANRNIPQLYTKSWTVTVIDHPTVNCYVLPVSILVLI